MNEKYLGTSKKKVAVISMVGAVVLLLIVGPNSATPSHIPKVIPEFNVSGHLLVPYERFMHFGSAFGYAHAVLGDTSTNNGTKQYFVWRGGFYHTETLKDQ